MNKVVKLILGLVFTMGTYVAANAQTDSVAAKDDAIVCRQISDNVFDCYVKENNSEKGKNLDNTKKDNYNNDKNNRSKEEMEQYQKDGEAPNDFNRSDVIERDNDIEGLDFSKETYPKNENPSSPMDRKNEDNVHMPGDVTEDDRMYGTERDKQERELLNEADDETYYQKKRDSLGVEA